MCGSGFPLVDRLLGCSVLLCDRRDRIALDEGALGVFKSIGAEKKAYRQVHRQRGDLKRVNTGLAYIKDVIKGTLRSCDPTRLRNPTASSDRYRLRVEENPVVTSLALRAP